MAAMNTVTESPSDEPVEYWGDGDPGSLPITQEEYAESVRQLVADSAPRRFAIVQDWGTRYDSRVAAWGLMLNERTQIIDADAGPRMTMDSIRLALRLYARTPHVTVRVHWIDPPPETEPDP
jgi:hypothetical protein